MAFDDLARHMASREGKSKLSQPAGTADEILAEAAKASRRLSRSRDLILGPILFFGGILALVLLGLYTADALHPTPNRLRAPESGGTVLLPTIAGFGIVGGIVVTGLLQTIRGLRNRSI